MQIYSPKFVLLMVYNKIFSAYMMIAEPRVRRLIYFVIYLLLGVIGGVSAFRPNPYLEDRLGGMTLIYLFGGMIVAGALVCTVSVLPGIWMFERAGLFALGIGISVYTTILILLGASAATSIIPAILILVFVLRWLEIKDYLLAPRKG